MTNGSSEVVGPVGLMGVGIKTFVGSVDRESKGVSVQVRHSVLEIVKLTFAGS